MSDSPDFDWDPTKRISTLAKHKVDFRVAIRMFEGPVLEIRSDRDEPRWLVIGVVNGVELALVYCLRNDLRRIITARRANRNERKKYYTHVTGGGDPPEE